MLPINASLRPVSAARRFAPDPAWTRDLVRDVAPVILLTRGLFIGLTLIIPLWRAVFGVPPLVLAHVGGTGTILDEWNRWDTRWYDDLARLGYNLRGPNGYKNVAFFPLYPLLIRAVHDGIAVLTRDVLGLSLSDPSYPPYLIPGLIVSNVCSIAASIFYYGLVRLDYGRAAARRAVALLALFPLSVFQFAAYSEGTFLLCVIAFFYTLRLERWWYAGLWGLLAAATRPPGAVLLAPFLIAWAEAHPVVAGSLWARARLSGRVLTVRPRVRLGGAVGAETAPRRPVGAVPLSLDTVRQVSPGRTPRRRAGDVVLAPSGAAAYPALVAESARRRFPWRSWPFHLRAVQGEGDEHPHDWRGEVRQAFRNMLPAVAIPAGLALFMLFLGRVFGDPLWFSRAQAAWWRTFAPPWVTLYISVAWPLGDLLHGKLTYWDPYALHDLAYAAGGLIVTWLAWRRLSRTQGVYMWLLWIVLLSSPAMLMEQGTHEPHHDVLMSLPRMLLMLFPLFTYLGLRRRLFPWLAATFSAGLVLYTALLLTGGWIA